MIQFNKTSIMAIQVFATRREVNIVSACAESIVRFRLIGLNRSEKLLWEKKLASVPCEWFLRKTGDYVYLWSGPRSDPNGGVGVVEVRQAKLGMDY